MSGTEGGTGNLPGARGGQSLTPRGHRLAVWESPAPRGSLVVTASDFLYFPGHLGYLPSSLQLPLCGCLALDFWKCFREADVWSSRPY